MTLQEPTTNYNEKTIKYTIAQYKKKQMILIPSPWQYVIINETTIGNGMLEAPIILLEGRLIATTFHTNMSHTINNNLPDILTLIAVYGVTQGKQTYINGCTKNSLRKELQRELRQLISTLNRKYQHHKLFILGDMQDTMLTDAIDNSIPENAVPMNKDGVLHLITNPPYNFKSLVFESARKQQLPYITRRTSSPLHNARGLTHFCSDQESEEIYEGGNIDKFTPATLITTDHFILQAELRFKTNSTAGNERWVDKVQYPRIANIQLDKNNCSGPTEPVFDTTCFMTKQREEDKELLSSIQDIANDTNTPAYKCLLNAQTVMNDLDLRVIAAHTSEITMNKTATKGCLITRKAIYRTKIEQCLSYLMDGIDSICEETNLIVKSSEGVNPNSFKGYHDSYLPSSKMELDKDLNKDPLGSSIFRTTLVTTYLINNATTIHQILTKASKTKTHNLTNYEYKLCNHHFRQLNALAATDTEVTLAIFISTTLEKVHSKYEEWNNNLEAIEQYRDTDTYGDSNRHQIGMLQGFSNDELQKLDGILRTDSKFLHGLHGIDPIYDHENSLQKKACSTTDEHNYLDWFQVDLTVLGLQHDPINTTLPLSSIDNINWNDIVTEESFLASLAYTITMLKRILNRLFQAATQYRNTRLKFAAKTNNTSVISKIIVRKPRESPEPHNRIQDRKTKQWRLCKSDSERLIGTNQEHQKWMDNSSAIRSNFFVDLTKDEVGVCGATLHPDRVFSPTYAEEKIPNFHQLSSKIQAAIYRAHTRSHIRDLFRPPDEHNELFNWPYYLDPHNNHQFSEPSLEQDFYKMIRSIPGKARHEGFTLAVIGRLPIKWQQLTWRIIQSILITRLPPKEIKKFTRVPIPKTAPGETRPLAIINDIYCYVCFSISKPFTTALEKLNILFEEIHAYREEHGCDLITLLQAVLKEDALQNNKCYVCIDEDEEKFFDRISLELQLAALIHVRCPSQGYLEMKAEDLLHRKVKIVTRLGITHTTFICGTPQGSPLSCVFSNCVILLKHILMRNIIDDLQNTTLLESPAEDTNSQFKTNFPYKFKTKDAIVKIRPTVLSQSFCDDNNRYIYSINQWLAIKAAQAYIDITGDFSIVTKLGRKGSKSSVTIFNVKPELVEKIPHYSSMAWSFKDDTVVMERLKLYIYCNESIPSIQQHPNLTDDRKRNIQRILNKYSSDCWVKHLGITEHVATTSFQRTSNYQISQAFDRLKDIKTKDLQGKTDATIMNTLITSMIGYGALLSNPTPPQVQTLDNKLCQMASSQIHKLTKTDSKLLTMLPMHLGGSGVKSFSQIITANKMRELTVHFNNTHSTTSAALRSRHYAQMKTIGIDYKKTICINLGITDVVSDLLPTTSKNSNSIDTWIANQHLLCNNIVSPLLIINTNWLAKYGFYFRERNTLFVTILVEILMKKLPINTVPIGFEEDGHRFAKHMADHLLHVGKEHLLHFSTYGTLFTYLRQLHNHLVNSVDKENETLFSRRFLNRVITKSTRKDLPYRLHKNVLIASIQQTATTVYRNITQTYDCYELQLPAFTSYWNMNLDTVIANDWNKLTLDQQSDNTSSLILRSHKYYNHYRSNFLNLHQLKSTIPNPIACRASDILLAFSYKYNIPCIVATNGGGSDKQETTHGSRGSATAVIGLPGPPNNQSWQQFLNLTGPLETDIARIANKLQSDLDILSSLTLTVTTPAATTQCPTATTLSSHDESLYQNNCWINGCFVPILIRTRKLPAFIGNKKVDCKHGETDALNIALETLPRELPFILLMDSSHV